MTRGVDADADLLAAFRDTVRRKIARDLEDERAQAEARRARVIPAVTRVVAEALRDAECQEVWLFGSYAWGQPTELRRE